MSITFWCPDAPTRKVTPYPEQDPDFVIDESLLPEINMSNSNALKMLELMALPTEYGGEIKQDELPALAQRLIRLLNSEQARSDGLLEPRENPPPVRFVQDGNVTRIDVGPRIFHGGRTDEYVRERARQLLELVRAAQESNYRVCWG